MTDDRKPGAAASPEPNFIDPGGPEVLADEGYAFSLQAGIITIVFTRLRATHPGRARVVVGRLSMPTAGAEALVRGLGSFLKEMGLDASAPGGPGPGKTLQ